MTGSSWVGIFTCGSIRHGMPVSTREGESRQARPVGTVEDFLARLIEGSPDCIKVLDLDGRLLSMNAGGMRALEIADLKPLTGTPWIEFWKEPHREAARVAVNSACAGKVAGSPASSRPSRRTDPCGSTW